MFLDQNFPRRRFLTYIYCDLFVVATLHLHLRRPKKRDSLRLRWHYGSYASLNQQHSQTRKRHQSMPLATILASKGNTNSQPLSKTVTGFWSYSTGTPLTIIQ
eukprot:3018257-Amphidinium_carterae.1